MRKTKHDDVGGSTASVFTKWSQTPFTKTIKIIKVKHWRKKLDFSFSPNTIFLKQNKCDISTGLHNVWPIPALVQD